MTDSINWTCPHCNKPQTSISRNRHNRFIELDVGENKFGNCGLSVQAFACVNADCKEIKIDALFYKFENKGNNKVNSQLIDKFNLRPKGKAKPQPGFIPSAIIQDYQEACLIKDLSPKASATLARRCLQGMMYDFCDIRKDTLNKQIMELDNRVKNGSAPKGVDEDTMIAIDGIRSIGNIGAHMEKDVNLIIDIDPDEAEILIQLIENLFEDWYVAREKRRQVIKEISNIVEHKNAQKQSGRASSTS